MSKNTYKVSLFREGALVSSSEGHNVATAEASRAASFATVTSGSVVSALHTFPRTNYCEVYARVLPKDQKFGGRISSGSTSSPPSDRLGFSSTNLEGVATEEVIEGRRFILRKSKFEIPITRTGEGLTFLISGGTEGTDGLGNGSSKPYIFEPQDPLNLLNGDTVVVEHSAYYDVEDSWDPAMGGDPLWFQEIGSGVATISVMDVDGGVVRVEEIPYSLRIPLVGVRSSDSSATWLFGGRDGRRNLRSTGVSGGGGQFVRALGSSGDVELRTLRPGTSLNPASRLPLIDFDLGEGDRRHVFPASGGTANSRLVTSTLADFTVVSPASNEVSFHALSFTLVNAFGPTQVNYPWVTIPFSGHTVDDLFSLSSSDGLAMTTPLPTENRILLTAILSFEEEIEVSAEESFRLSIPVRLTVPPSGDVKAGYPGYVQWGPSPPEGATLLTGGPLDPSGLGDPSWAVSGGGEVVSANGGSTGFLVRVNGAGGAAREIPITGGSAAMFRARVSSSFGGNQSGRSHEVVLEAKGPSGELLESTALLAGRSEQFQGSNFDVGVVLGDISIPEGTASLVFRLSSTGGNFLWARDIELWIES